MHPDLKHKGQHLHFHVEDTEDMDEGWRFSSPSNSTRHSFHSKNCVRALSEVHHTTLICAFSKKQHKFMKICSMNLPTFPPRSEVLEASWSQHKSCRLPWWNSDCLMPGRVRNMECKCKHSLSDLLTETHLALGFLGLQWQGRHPPPDWGMFRMAELQWAGDRDFSLF